MDLSSSVANWSASGFVSPGNRCAERTVRIKRTAKFSLPFSKDTLAAEWLKWWLEFLSGGVKNSERCLKPNNFVLRFWKVSRQQNCLSRQKERPWFMSWLSGSLCRAGLQDLGASPGCPQAPGLCRSSSTCPGGAGMLQGWDPGMPARDREGHLVCQSLEHQSVPYSLSSPGIFHPALM